MGKHQEYNNKPCKACGCVKPLEEFHVDRNRKDGVKSNCKSCCVVWSRAHREKTAARRESDPNADNASHDGLASNCKECKKRRELRSKYGIGLRDYKRMLEDQNDRCAICEGECQSGNSLAVDHCHSTGDVRGLLCSNCNKGLGHFKDSPILLREAIAYLDKPDIV
jgi:hypothetical protein